MAGQYWVFFIVCSASIVYLGVNAEEDQGLVNINLKINRLNLTRYFDDGHIRRRNPFFFNLDIPHIFTMNLDTKKNEGTSLGLRVLHPLNRFLKIFGIDQDSRRTEEGWTVSKRNSKRGNDKDEEDIEETQTKEKSVDALKKEDKEP